MHVLGSREAFQNIEPFYVLSGSAFRVAAFTIGVSVRSVSQPRGTLAASDNKVLEGLL